MHILEQRNVAIASIEMENNSICLVPSRGTACLVRPPIPVTVLEHRENKTGKFPQRTPNCFAIHFHKEQILLLTH